jgi:hypothetical protein
MKNMILRCALLAAVAVGFPVPAFAQEAVPQASSPASELKLTMQNGRVTLIANNIPLRQILQEWARIGQTTIVNAEKLSSPMMTLQVVDAPERDVLDILLRSAAGYIAAPRPALVTNAAVYDRVTIMATSRAPAASAVVTQQSVPTFQRPPQPVDDDDPINVTTPQMLQPPPNPVTGQFPGMPPFAVQPGPNTPAAQPAPLTSPRPGALPTPPAPTPMFPNPYQPQVVRPGGPGGPGGGPGGPGGGPGGQ